MRSIIMHNLCDKSLIMRWVHKSLCEQKLRNEFDDRKKSLTTETTQSQKLIIINSAFIEFQ